MAETIRGWLHGKDVLITGGTGYFGKGLIEKLLRTTEVRRIYLIIRSKRDLSPETRWQQVCQNLVFERLRSERPDAFSKVAVLDGDVAEKGLGLSDRDRRELCENVAVVFHAAACVRFDDPLSSAILLNVRGTKELLDLAKSMKKLECFQYVSTAYSTPKLNDEKIGEVLYPQQYDWRTLIDIAEREDNLMNLLQHKIITVYPNTYTFSKCVAENMVAQIKENLPVVILRPSVVVGSLQEPEPGWIDNLNGPAGILCGMGAGVLRVFRCQPETFLDIVPIDIAVNAMIVSAWATKHKRTEKLPVYNCTYGDTFQATFEELREIGEKITPVLPVNNDLWYPFACLTANTYYLHFLFYTLQVLPAWFVDSLLIILRKEPRLTKLNIRIYKAMNALKYFSCQQFEFDNTNYKSIFNLIPSEEREIFDLKFKEVTKSELLVIYGKGLKKFILHEKDEDLDNVILLILVLIVMENSLQNSKKMAETIRGWLHGKDVLITGGTGYFGKGLIEKLLRTTEVRRIYLIIRSKRDLSPETRWQQVCQNLVFERLRSERPDAFSKVAVLDGDVAEKGLGLSDRDRRELCENVAVVFHAAACVRFDDPLSSAILLNVRGTKELLDLAKSMKKLECFQYVSTAYSTPKLNDEKIGEVLYPQQYDWRTLIDIAEREDNLMNLLQHKIITVYPNTYTFSKSIAENMVAQIKENLPVVILRPSVVVGSLQEPEPGWIDNLNGPIGILCGIGTGVLRVSRCQPETFLDMVPIDVVVNAMIVSAWVTKHKRTEKLPVYNCTYGDTFQTTYEELREIGEAIAPELPVNNDLWYPFVYYANNPYYLHFLFYTLQVLPAWFVDSLLIILRKEPRLTKLNIRIYKAMNALKYFSCQQIEFDNTNYKS
uniref:Fatty acyl-CoA reductase n=1 Tax=Rhodnius prolixus TaxID=13249 RepID=T1ICI4_RHOPR